MGDASSAPDVGIGLFCLKETRGQTKQDQLS